MRPFRVLVEEIGNFRHVKHSRSESLFELSCNGPLLNQHLLSYCLIRFRKSGNNNKLHEFPRGINTLFV
jgi:hypothetical protein